MFLGFEPCIKIISSRKSIYKSVSEKIKEIFEVLKKMSRSDLHCFNFFAFVKNMLLIMVILFMWHYILDLTQHYAVILLDALSFVTFHICHIWQIPRLIYIPSPPYINDYTHFYNDFVLFKMQSHMWYRFFKK